MSSAESSNFKRIILESNDQQKTVDLSAGVVSVDYYEDLFSPTVTAKVTVINTGDSIPGKEDDRKFQSIYNGLPLRGGERLRMYIVDRGTGKNGGEKGGLDFGSTPDKYLFVSSITNVIVDSSRESFTLNLVSREAITNETARVVKKYDKTISSSVTSILENVLKSNKINEVEETANARYAFIGNLKKPFTTLVWLASKAIPNTSSKDATAGFFFYQTQDGFNFRSIDKLIETEPKATYTYSQVPTSQVETNTDFKIISFNTNKNQNLIEKLRLGTYSSQRMYFNPATFEFTDPRKGLFKFDRDKIVNLGTNGNISLPTIEDGSSTSLGEVPTRILSGIVNVGTLDKETSTEVNADALKHQSQSIMRYNMLMTQTISMTVSCNTDLRAGDILDCKIPKLSSDEDALDYEVSGLYMIKELCHHFEPTSSYTSMKLVRDNFGIHKK